MILIEVRSQVFSVAASTPHNLLKWGIHIGFFLSSSPDMAQAAPLVDYCKTANCGSIRMSFDW